MKSYILCALIGLAPHVSLAQDFNSADTYANAEQALTKVKGVVRRVDVSSQQITLKHEEIPNLNMPGMTMPFYLAEPAMLTQFKAGDRVLFSADDVNGRLTIMWIEKQ